jgi:hypothetical protein
LRSSTSLWFVLFQSTAPIFDCECARKSPVGQVSLAVLLDNFITASARIELEEKEREMGALLREKQANNPLEPLLIKVGTI